MNVYIVMSNMQVELRFRKKCRLYSRLQLMLPSIVACIADSHYY